MEIRALKDASLLLKGKSASVVLDTSGSLTAGEVSISAPGEYEVHGVAIVGIASGDHTDYKIKMDGVTLGLVFGKIGEEEEEMFSTIDVLLLGGGDPKDSVLKLEPNVVAVFGQDEPSLILKDIGKEGIVPQAKLVVKKDSLPAELEAVWLKA